MNKSDQPNTPPNRARNYADTGNKKREAIIAVVCAAAVLGFVVYGVTHMGKVVGHNRMHGIILEKHFDSTDQTQITVGSSGLSKREIDGQYWFKVHVENRDVNYFVYVPLRVYQNHKIGDKYVFVRPPKPTD